LVLYYDDSNDIGLFVKSQPRHELFGAMIFKVRHYEEAENKFYEWVERSLLPYRKKR
jgi:hypothetical protein